MRITKNELFTGVVSSDFEDHVANALFMIPDDETLDIDTRLITLDEPADNGKTGLIRADIRTMNGGLLYSGGIQWVEGDLND